MDDFRRRRAAFYAALRACVTKEDFDAISSELVLFNHRTEEKHFHREIKHLEVLSAYLAYYRGRKDHHFFNNILDYFISFDRVDYLQCFIGYVDFNAFFDLSRVTYGNPYLKHLCRKAPIDVITFLLDQGLNVNERIGYSEKKTILFLACEYGKCDLIDLLLSRGADVNLKDYYGSTAAAVAVRRDDVRVLDRLIMAGIYLKQNEEKDDLWMNFIYGKKSIEVAQRLIDMKVSIPIDMLPLTIHFYKHKRDKNSINRCQQLTQLMLSIGCDPDVTPIYPRPREGVPSRLIK